MKLRREQIAEHQIGRARLRALVQNGKLIAVNGTRLSPRADGC
jgi:hypothetical protein